MGMMYHAQALDIDETGIPDFTSKKNEPIRPGDMMQHWDPIFVSGDKRGLKEASVLSVNRKRYPMLILSTGDALPPNTNVKRLKVMRRNKLEDHPFGIFRHVTEFKSHTASIKKADEVGAVNKGKSDMLKNKLQKHLNKLHDKIGDTGSALFHKGYKRKINKNDMDDIEDSESKSCPASVSYSSSSSTDNMKLSKSPSLSSKKKSSYTIF